MSRHDTYVRLIRSTVLVCSIVFGGSSLALAEEPTSPPTPSDDSVQERAVPQGGRCTITTYYSDAAMTKQVGTFSNCPGSKRGLTGKKTKYFETETIALGNPSQGKSGGPGSLPCEFLAEGCGNIPSPRN